MDSIIQLILAALISGAAASTLVGVLFTGYITRKKILISSQQEWKENRYLRFFLTGIILMKRLSKAV